MDNPMTLPQRGIQDKLTASGLSLAKIQENNERRKTLRATLPTGGWYVKTLSASNYYNRFEVKRRVGAFMIGGSDQDETVVPASQDRQVKEFIAFSRNDTPEKEIDYLLSLLADLRHYEQDRHNLINTLQSLRIQNERLQEKVDALQATLDRSRSLHAEATMMQETLAFYADERHWQWQIVTHPMLNDAGTRARETLRRLAPMPIPSQTASLTAAPKRPVLPSSAPAPVTGLSGVPSHPPFRFKM